MKTFQLRTLLLATLAALLGQLSNSSSALAEGGSMAGGGGNTQIRFSTAQEVSTALFYAGGPFLEEFRSGALKELVAGKDGSPLVESVVRAELPKRIIEIDEELGARFGGGLGIWGALGRLRRETKIDLKTSGDCSRSDGSHVDASVDMNDPNSPICFSLERLQRLPPGLLKEQIVGLLAHEFMHKLGYGESDAQLVQMYFRTEVATGLSNRRVEFAKALENFNLGTQNLLNRISRNSNAKTCAQLRGISSSMSKMKELLLMQSYDLSPERLVGNPVLSSLLMIDAAGSSGKHVAGFGTSADSSSELDIKDAFCMGLMSRGELLPELQFFQTFYVNEASKIPKMFPPSLNIKP